MQHIYVSNRQNVVQVTRKVFVLFSFYSVSISLYRTKCVTNIQHEILCLNSECEFVV